MLKADSEVFIRIPSESEQRILHRGRVLEIAEDLYSVQLDEEELTLEPGGDLFLFFEIKRKFHQQLARIESVQKDLGLIVKLATLGDPVSAESREYYRVSTISADVRVTVGSETNCPVRDISATGFAAVSRSNLALGSVHSAEVHYGEESYSGSICVQSQRELRPGQIRYGFRYLDDDESSGELRDGLSQISLAVQRAQLQRR